MGAVLAEETRLLADLLAAVRRPADPNLTHVQTRFGHDVRLIGLAEHGVSDVGVMLLLLTGTFASLVSFVLRTAAVSSLL